MDPGERVPLAPILEHYGMASVPDYGRNTSVLCPFHDDTAKSASVNAEEELFQCFTCGVRGDVYALIMQVEGVDFVEAKRRAEAIAGASGHEVRSQPRAGVFVPHRSRPKQGKRRKPASRGRWI